jgi:hypothetical protein
MSYLFKNYFKVIAESRQRSKEKRAKMLQTSNSTGNRKVKWALGRTKNKEGVFQTFEEVEKTPSFFEH